MHIRPGERLTPEYWEHSIDSTYGSDYSPILSWFLFNILCLEKTNKKNRPTQVFRVNPTVVLSQSRNTVGKKRLCESLHCHEFDVTVLGCAAVGKTRRHWLKRNRRAWRFPVDLSIWNLFSISIPVHTLLRIWLMCVSSLRMSFSLITKSRDTQANLNYIIKDQNDLWKKAHSCLRTCASRGERLEPSALIMQQVVRMRPSSALFVLCVHLMYTYTSEGVRECVYVCVFNV